MEIERKFKLNKPVFFENLNNLNVLRKDIVEQRYLSVSDNEVRVRKIEHLTGNCLYYLTIKSKGDICRNEIEFEIHSSKYDEIVNSNICLGEPIKKFRYAVELTDNLLAEIDIYGAGLLGLMVVEVEFSSVEEAESFIKPDWFGEEITNDATYKNKNLAFQRTY